MIKNVFAIIGVVATALVGKELYKEYKKTKSPVKAADTEDDVEGVDDLAEEDNFFDCDDLVAEND